MRTIRILACIPFVLLVSTVSAQARIDRILFGGVSVQRAGVLRAEPGVVGATLRPGDLLTATDSSALEFRCTTTDATRYKFAGRFRVLVDVPVNAGCQITILAGHADVLAEAPSHTTGGTIPLASKGTQYAVDVTRSGADFACTAAVFEGMLVARATGRTVTAGTTFSWDGPKMLAEQVTEQQIKRSAAVYASFDLAEAQSVSTAGAPALSLETLTALHYGVLANPTDTAKRVALAKQQMAYRIYEQAAYNLKRARVIDDRAMRRYEIDPAAVRANATLNDRVFRNVPPSGTSAKSTVMKSTMALQRTSSDYYSLAKASDGIDAAKARQNATLALAAQATDGKLSDTELKTLRELLGRTP